MKYNKTIMVLVVFVALSLAAFTSPSGQTWIPYVAKYKVTQERTLSSGQKTSSVTYELVAQNSSGEILRQNFDADSSFKSPTSGFVTDHQRNMKAYKLLYGSHLAVAMQPNLKHLPSGPKAHTPEPDKQQVVDGVLAEPAPIYLKANGVVTQIGTAWMASGYEGVLIREESTQQVRDGGSLHVIRELIDFQPYNELPATAFSLEGFTVTDSPASCNTGKQPSQLKQ